MKALVLTLALLSSASMAAAQTRPSTVTRPCAASQRDVQANGAIVLGTGGYTYDRFVRDRSFCERDESTEPAFVPSRDNQACFIGYRCKSRSNFFDD
uniref:YARHG domain-containing protein n=1 Tax=Bosea sp. NBC_00436 TaxID=2969620 RepID=A0A9E7ZP15_9HYPH